MLFQSLLGGVLWGIVCSCSVFTPKESIASQACGRELAQRLSSGAKIYCPGSEAFDNSTKRWSTFDAPTFRMTVEVATQNDVAEVVKYANRYDLPFLAVNGAHGAQSTVGGVRNGIMIWMRQLNSVKVAADGQTATFGGGILDKAVTDGLWAAGKQTGRFACHKKYSSFVDNHSYRRVRMCKSDWPWTRRRPRLPTSATRPGLRSVCIFADGSR